MKSLCILGLFFGGAQSSLQAQELSGGPGTAEFQYLGNLIYARPAGIAGAYTSLAQGVDAVGTNPAGVSKADPNRIFSGTLRYHFVDITSGNVTYGFPGESGRSYAFSAAYLNYGKISELDENGNETGKVHMPVSFNPTFTGATKVNDKIRVGVTVKGFSEYLADITESQLGWGWGVDAGLLFQPSAKNIGFGLALLNLGRKEQSQLVGGSAGGLLPVSIKGGMYYYPSELPKGKLALDVEVPWHDVILISGGIEYAYNNALTLRCGSRVDWNEVSYLLEKVTVDKPGDLMGGNALKVASGFTFQADGIALDYAVQYWYGLSWLHALTLRYVVL